MSLSDQLWCPASAQVTVLQARGLRIKGKGGTNDAYAVMQVGKEKYQTSVVEKSVAPVWKEEATFDLPQQQQQRGGGGGGTERSTLHVHVLHRALVGPDKLLGQAVINLLQLSEDRTRNKTEWFKLLDKTGKADKDRGEVLVDIQFMRNNMTASMFDLSAAGKSRSRLGKFKDKVRGKKKESDTVSTIVPSFTQVLTDSEEEGNGDAEAAAGKDEKKKKHKMKSLFSPKSNLQKNMSQSMSVLPGKNSPLSGSQSSGLNVDPSEGKKKFKFKIHKRSGSSDNKDSSSGLQKQGATEQSNLCINGSHIYCEEPPARTSRIGSNFSLASSGHGSMEDVPDSSPPSVDSLRGVRQYSPWTEEEEEMAEVENIKEDVEEERITLEEEERMRQEEDAERLAEEKRRQEQRRVEEEEKRQREEEERIRIEEEKAQEERRRQEEEQRLAEEKRRMEEEERRRNEEEKLRKEEEERIQREEEERSRQEEEERARREEERERLAEEKRRLEEEEERRRIKEEEKRQREEEERIRMAEERAKEERRRQEEERKLAEEKIRLEEEERRMIEEEEVRRLEEQERKRIEEEERIRMEEEMAQEQQRREEEERAKRQEEERKLAEQKRRLEEEERRQREEEEWKRQEEEDKLAEEKRLEEEERRRVQEEEVRKEEEEKRREEEERSRREEEELVRKLAEEHEEKRRLEEQERKRMEQEERIKKEEEEKARREKEEYERLVEKKIKLEEEERKRIEAEEKIRKEKEERVKAEEDRRKKEEKRRQEEEQEKLAEEKRIMEEQQRRIEEEEKKQREEEERIREEEERRHQEEERKRIVEEERIRQEEEEKIRMEKERRSREAEEDKNKMEEEEKARKLEKVIRNAEERKKRANKTKQEVAGTKSKVGSSAQVCSTNPFDEDFSNNPFDENPNPPDSSTVSMVQQRSQPAVSSAGSKTSSTDEKDLREKRPAPLPPGRNQERQSQREQDGSTRHLVQVNKQSKDKDDKTVSVPPQRSVHMITPLSRSPTDTKNPQSLAQNKGKRPAPSAPAEPKKASSSDSKIANKSGSEAKREPIAYGLNPFEDDEDENEPTAQDTAGSIQEPPAVSQAADGDAASQAKIKSSKKARAPLLPATTAAASSTSISQNMEGGHDTGATTQDDDLTHPQHPEEAPVQESQPVMAAAQEAGGKKEAPPVTSRRLQPVKPLNPLGQQPVSVAQGEIDNKSTGIHSDVEEKTKANDTELKGPYAQLTREELISLVLKQDNQLSERDKKISELEQYIDNLLVRVMEESPTILMSMNSMKKTV